MDGVTGVVTLLAKVDAFKVAVARNGTVYGVTGGPSGGRVVRISRAVGSCPWRERGVSARTATDGRSQRRCSRAPSR